MNLYCNGIKFKSFLKTIEAGKPQPVVICGGFQTNWHSLWTTSRMPGDLKVHQHLSLTAQSVSVHKTSKFEMIENGTVFQNQTIQDFVAGRLFRFERRPKKDTSDILGHLFV